MSIRWLGVGELEAALTKVAGQAEEASRALVERSAAMVEAAAKANFDGSHARGRPHVGGSKPNVVTGTLRRSIHADPVRRYGLSDYGTVVGPHVIYGRRVELGYNGSTPHPYFAPAVQAVRPRFAELSARTWREFLTAR